MNFEAPLTSLVWLTSIVSVVLTYVVSYVLIADLGDGTLWWKLSTIITCGTLAGRDHPGAGEGLHLGRVEPRQGGRHLVARGRRVAQHPLGPRRRQLQRLLDRPQHRGADVDRVPRQRVERGDGGPDARARGVRVRPRGVRLPRHGPGDDRRGLLRPGDRQRAVGLRAVGDREHSRHQAGAEEGLRLDVAVREGQGRCSRRTTAPATRSRRPRSRC